VSHLRVGIVNQDNLPFAISFIHEKIFLVSGVGRPWVLVAQFASITEGSLKYLCMDYHKPCTTEEESDYPECRYLEGARCNFGSAFSLSFNLTAISSKIWDMGPDDFTPEFILSLLNSMIEDSD